MRSVTKITLHATMTKAGDIKTLEDLHHFAFFQSFSHPPAHFYLFPDGRVERIYTVDRPSVIDGEDGEHCISLCFVGGVNDHGDPVDPMENNPALLKVYTEITSALLQQTKAELVAVAPCL